MVQGWRADRWTRSHCSFLRNWAKLNASFIKSVLNIPSNGTPILRDGNCICIFGSVIIKEVASNIQNAANAGQKGRARTKEISSGFDAIHKLSQQLRLDSSTCPKSWQSNSLAKHQHFYCHNQNHRVANKILWGPFPMSKYWTLDINISSSDSLRRSHGVSAIQTLGEGFLKPPKNHLFGRAATPTSRFFTRRRSQAYLSVFTIIL